MFHTNRVRSLFLLILLLPSVILGFKFKFGLDISVLAAVFSFAFLRHKEKISKEALVFLCLLLIYAFYLLLSMFVQGSFEYSDGINIFVKVTLYTSALLVMSLYLVKNMGTPFITCCYILLWIVAFHSIIVLIMFFFPDIRGAVYQYSNVSPLMMTSLGEFRIAGLSLGGGAVLSIFHAFGLISAYIINREQAGGKISLSILALLIVSSMIFIGRSGFLIFFIFILIEFVTSRGKFEIRKVKASSFFIFILFIITTFIGSLYLEYREPSDSLMDQAIDRTLSDFTANDKPNTIEILFEMTNIPNLELLTVFVGTGSYGRHEHYSIDTDIGYIRMYYFSGVLGVLLALGPFFYILICCSTTLNAKYSSYMLGITICLLVAEYKEPMLYARHLFQLYLLFSFVYLLSGRYEEKV